MLIIKHTQHHERYERLLRRAKTEDLSEVSGIGCLYQSGIDKFGRPVIVFVGKWFNFTEINLDKVFQTSNSTSIFSCEDPVVNFGVLHLIILIIKVINVNWQKWTLEVVCNVD